MFTKMFSRVGFKFLTRLLFVWVLDIIILLYNVFSLSVNYKYQLYSFYVLQEFIHCIFINVFMLQCQL